MAIIRFFEKPGCINNTKQKKLLALAGHDVVAENLLTHPWTRDSLLEFLGPLPLFKWFNPTAPAITRGNFNPAHQTPETAIDAMLRDPLLIKRPLMEISGEKLVGFDLDAINRIAALGPSEDPRFNQLMTENLVNCPKQNTGSQCD